jgi:beta-phosphoglucomutase-like phosphatase (HAD superfamily)/dTDP-glucose pyrophosphorylase
MTEKIKVILFDLDGVLINSRVLHYEAFRDALNEFCPTFSCDWKFHESNLDGLSTRLKIQKCIELGILKEELAENVMEKKQVLTKERLSQFVKPRESLKLLLSNFVSDGYRLICASNSIKHTVEATLTYLEVFDFFEAIYGNEDVQHPKPAPDIYMLAMKNAGCDPSQTLICEDSRPGRTAAYASGAHVCEIEDAEDCTYLYIKECIQSIEKGQSFQRISADTYFQVVIPMAGNGQRFRNEGYTLPKPFIPVGGKPMIEWVIENMIPNIHCKIHFIFIVRDDHKQFMCFDTIFEGIEKYKMGDVTYELIFTNGVTEGAACSVLLAESQLILDKPLILANSDQYVEWNSDSFYNCLLNKEYDGQILTFYQPNEKDSKWSYAKVYDETYVEKVAEKVWISPNATVGIYGWSRAGDFVRYAKDMIAKNMRVNNEFYVCPVYNEAIEDDKKIRIKLCKGMWGLGVPSDLDIFKKQYLGEA